MLIKISKLLLFVQKRCLLKFKRNFIKFFFLILIFFICIIHFLLHYQQKLSSNVNHQSLKSKILQNRFEPIADQFKQDIYNECRLFAHRNHLMRPSKSKQNRSDVLEDVYILLYYSPKRDNEDGRYFQLATSYLLSQNLQQLSSEQQKHTYITLFIHLNSTKLVHWFENIYSPYIAKLDLIDFKEDSDQLISERMIKYIKFHRNIHFETILFLLKDDYIFDVDMLIDTIDFFSTHNPCFIYQTDFSDRCRFDMTNEIGHLLVPGKVRLWRSISSTKQTYTCRLKTLLVFEDLIQYSKNDFDFDQQIRIKVDGNEIFFCAIPQYSARLETIILPADVNLTMNDDGIAVYYKDWSSIARQALTQAQDQNGFPYPKINVRTMFS